MSLYIFWLRKESLIKYVRNWWGHGRASKMRTAAYKERGRHASCVLEAYNLGNEEILRLLT